MQADGSVVVTSRMGRIDSEAGRKMAARDAAEAEKKRIAEAEGRGRLQRPKEAKAAAKEAEKQAKLAAKAAKEQPATVAAAPSRHRPMRPTRRRPTRRQPARPAFSAACASASATSSAARHDPEPEVSVSKKLQTFGKDHAATS